MRGFKVFIFCTLAAVLQCQGLTLDLYDEIACSPDTRPRIISADPPIRITTPDYDPTDEGATYPPDALCEWQITQDGPNELEFKFINFTLETSEQCKNDYFEIYDGEDGDDPDRLIGRYCGQQLPDPVVRDSGSTIFLRFVSDESLEYPGAIARAGFITLGNACNQDRPQLITAQNGTITTPNWPIRYESELFCTWHLQAPIGVNWIINTTFFETEECCACDTMVVYDGADAAAPRLGTWWGENTQPPQIRSSGRDLYLVFSTDYSISEFSGFLLLYSQVDASSDGNREIA